MISFVINKEGSLLSGESMETAVDIVGSFKPEAILINCVPPSIIHNGLDKIKKATNLPFGAYGNGDGGASNVDGWEFTGSDDVLKYAECCKEWIQLGANIVGGCCGTSPEYTKEYSKLKNKTLH